MLEQRLARSPAVSNSTDTLLTWNTLGCQKGTWILSNKSQFWQHTSFPLIILLCCLFSSSIMSDPKSLFLSASLALFFLDVSLSRPIDSPVDLCISNCSLQHYIPGLQTWRLFCGTDSQTHNISFVHNPPSPIGFSPSSLPDPAARY